MINLADKIKFQFPKTNREGWDMGSKLYVYPKFYMKICSLIPWVLNFYWIFIVWLKLNYSNFQGNFVIIIRDVLYINIRDKGMIFWQTTLKKKFTTKPFFLSLGLWKKFWLRWQCGARVPCQRSCGAYGHQVVAGKKGNEEWVYRICDPGSPSIMVLQKQR